MNFRTEAENQSNKDEAKICHQPKNKIVCENLGKKNQTLHEVRKILTILIDSVKPYYCIIYRHGYRQMSDLPQTTLSGK